MPASLPRSGFASLLKTLVGPLPVTSTLKFLENTAFLTQTALI